MMAAAAGEGTVDRSGAMAAATTTNSRFAVACGALSRYVKAAETMARSAAARPLLPLMPGADHDDDTAPMETQEDQSPEAGPAPTQLTIVYGGRVLVLDDVPANRAASLLQVAAACTAGGAPRAKLTATDLPVVRKASLQRFLERRVARVAARGGPYARPGARSSDRDIELTLAL